MEKAMMIDLMTNGGLTIPKLLLESYRAAGLNEEECMLLIHLHGYIKDGNAFPTPTELSERMTCTSEQCTELLRKLLQKGFIDIVQETNQHIYSESYSLEPLWDRLISHKMLSAKNDAQIQQEDALYSIFEKEFGRPLSPMECESLTMWIDNDHQTPEMIKAALREAVISGKLNFRYIDRILFDWKKSGVKTLEQAQTHGEKIRSRFNPKKSSDHNDEKKPAKFPMYNWLEN